MANFGYSKAELDELSSFGETPEERARVLNQKSVYKI